MMGNLFDSGGGEQKADLEDAKTRAMFEHAVPLLGNSMTIQDIVKKVHGGHSGSWNNAVSTMGQVTGGHDQVLKHGQKLLQALESSWSGAGAEGAAAKLKQGMKAAEASSKVYSQNQQFYTDNAHAFDNVKRSLPTLPDKEPEPGFLDSLAPWETDTQEQAKKYQADVEQARQTYSKYEGDVVKAGQDVDGNFGNLQEFEGNLGDIERDASTTVKDAGTGVVDINGSGGGDGGPGGSGRSVDGGGAGPVGGGGQVGDGSVPGGVTGGGSVPGSQSPQYAGSGTSPNDTTGTSSYVSPDAARAGGGSYSTPGAPGVPGQAGGSGFGPGGSNSGTGFGPMGSPAAGFGPGGSGGAGSAGGGSSVGGGRVSVPGGGAAGGGYSSGSGGAAGAGGAAGSGGAAGGAGAGGAGAGKMTGAGGGFGPTGSGGSGGAAGGAGGGAAAAGGRGGMPMGAMGGAGRGGQGGDDEEHQRQYVLPDDEAFALTEDGEVLRDPSTGNVVTPPTIGE